MWRIFLPLSTLLYINPSATVNTILCALLLDASGGPQSSTNAAGNPRRPESTPCGLETQLAHTARCPFPCSLRSTPLRPALLLPYSIHHFRPTPCRYGLLLYVIHSIFFVPYSCFRLSSRCTAYTTPLCHMSRTDDLPAL